MNSETFKIQIQTINTLHGKRYAVVDTISEEVFVPMFSYDKEGLEKAKEAQNEIRKNLQKREEGLNSEEKGKKVGASGKAMKTA